MTKVRAVLNDDQKTKFDAMEAHAGAHAAWCRDRRLRLLRRHNADQESGIAKAGGGPSACSRCDTLFERWCGYNEDNDPVPCPSMTARCCGTAGSHG